MTTQHFTGRFPRTSFSNDSISLLDARNRVLTVVGIFLLLALNAPAATALGNAPGDIAAHLITISGDVEAYVLRRSASGRTIGRRWVPAEEGMALDIEARVRTANGRARLEFTDGREDLGLASTAFQLEPNTEIGIADFHVDYENPGESRGLLELFRGAIRNFIGGWGENSGFSVRAGVAVCGLRDGEAIVEYDPAEDAITVRAVSGKAVLTGIGGSKLIDAGEEAAMVKGFFPGRGPS